MGLIQAGQRITAAALNSLPPQVATMTTGSIANSTTETAIATWVLPAGDASAVGQMYRLWGYGTADDTGTPTLRFRARLTSAVGTQIVDLTALTARSSQTNMPWSIDAALYFSAVGASGNFAFDSRWGDEFSTAPPGATRYLGNGTNAVDTTAAITIVVTAAWSAASASNTARSLYGALFRS